MTRLLTITVILLGVLHAAGFSIPQGVDGECEDTCGSHMPQVVKVEPSCCPLSEDTGPNQDEYCPMSEGPCVCGLRPADDHRPSDPVPMPQRDRDTLQMPRAPPLIVRGHQLDTPNRLTGITSAEAIRSGFTHNQTQAFLGVWRR